MKEKRHLEVRFETHEITTISFRRNYPGTVFCRSCRTETLHLTVPEAASIVKSSETSIFRGIEAERLHSVETDSGLMVCGDSLSALAGERS